MLRTLQLCLPMPRQPQSRPRQMMIQSVVLENWELPVKVFAHAPRAGQEAVHSPTACCAVQRFMKLY